MGDERTLTGMAGRELLKKEGIDLRRIWGYASTTFAEAAEAGGAGA